MLRWPRGANEDAIRAQEAAEAEEQRARGREMGERLRAARFAHALTLEEAEQTTKINRAYLAALEAGRFDALPAPVYARGFMRSYARYLGLDPEEAVEAVPRDLPRPAGLEPLPGLRRTASSPPLWPGLPALNLPVIVAGGAAMVLVVLAIFVIPGLGGGDGLDSTGNTPTPTTGSAQPGATGTPGATAPPSLATVPPFEPGTVPAFVGVQRTEAESVLASLGLTPLIFETPNQAPEGQVFQQVPAPGTEIDPGGTITLFVSQGTEAAPGGAEGAPGSGGAGP